MVSTMQQRGMPGAVDRGADLGDAAGRAGRGLVVDDHHGLDRVRAYPRASCASISGGIGAAAPVAGQ